MFLVSLVILIALLAVGVLLWRHYHSMPRRFSSYVNSEVVATSWALAVIAALLLTLLITGKVQ